MDSKKISWQNPISHFTFKTRKFFVCNAPRENKTRSKYFYQGNSIFLKLDIIEIFNGNFLCFSELVFQNAFNSNF